MLTNIQFTTLNPHSWFATAELTQFNTSKTKNTQSFTDIDAKKNKKLIQSAGVRLLLSQLLNHLNITDSLSEHSFPYRLADTGYYVCFSHSQQMLAVAISTTHPIGIDTELRQVSWMACQRFFHPNEVSFLQSHPSSIRSQLATLLWQLKECRIKITQESLNAGMGFSFSFLFPELLAHVHSQTNQKNDNQLNQTLLIDDTPYHLLLNDSINTALLFPSVPFL